MEGAEAETELNTTSSSAVHPLPGTKRFVQICWLPERVSTQTRCTTPSRDAAIEAFPPKKKPGVC